ncbi:class I SAM-dependent methyltransferase [Enterococcus sp. LJL90]
MVIFVVAILAVGLLIWFYRALLEQSQEPSGLLGKWMMRLWNRVYLPMVAWSLRQVSVSAPRKILDVGVGNGASSHYLTQLFPTAEVVGIDISETGIALAQEEFAVAGLTFTVANVEALPYPDNHFDLITVYQNHFHWGNLEQGLSELERLVTPSGKILICCEATKVSYYLKELSKGAAFATYLAKLGLALQQTQQHRGWVLYEIRRK